MQERYDPFKSDYYFVIFFYHPRILLEKGAQPWGTTGAGTPFLVLASSAGCATIVKLLLDAGCKPDQASSSGSITALHKAASCGHRNCALMLLKYGANVNSVDSDGNTPLNRSMQVCIGKIMLKMAIRFM